MRTLDFRKVLYSFAGTIMICWLSSQMALILSGKNHPAGLFIIMELYQHGFVIEVIMAFGFISMLAGIACGIFMGGFIRYVSQILLIGIAALTAILMIGYFAFTILWLETFINPSEILASRFHEPGLWQDFLLAEGITLMVSLIAISLISLERQRPARKALGNAHFASGLEVRNAGFLKNDEAGIVLGKKYGVPLFSNGFEHVLLFAPTGSGKTRSIGIPNLFLYPYSVVCNDVKLTLFKTTSGYREGMLGHRCYCFAPASQERKTHRYNPLDLISNDPFQRMTDIQRIAHILMPDNKKSDPIWQQASRKLFKVLILYLLDTPERPTTLGEVNRLVKQQSFDDWLASILEETEHLDPEFYRNGYSYLNNHEKTRSSILETFSGYLELFDDPMIDSATSASDFDLRNLRKEKMTIYIGFTDDDMERLSPLLTLFWQQLISAMITRIPDVKEEPYPLLCLMDEFSSLGRIERLRRSLKLLREYRVRCILIMQYIAQTHEQYSHDEAKAFTNIKTKIAFATEDMADAEYVSKLLGTRTVRIHGGSVSTQTNGHSESTSYNHQAVPLLRPDEIMRLPENKSLILRTGHAPVKANQYVWYREPELKFLPMEESPVQEQTLKRMAFEKNILSAE